MYKDFIKATVFFIFGIAIIFYVIWLILSTIPNAHINPLGAAFGINLPDDLLNGNFNLKTVGILIVVSLLSVALVILNAYFGAAVTSHFVRPRVTLVTSSRGVLSSKWNPLITYILIRMSNFHKADLVDVRLSVVLTVEEIRGNGVKDEPFMCYLPIKDFSPTKILVMARQMPWTIAVPGDILLSNSLTTEYLFRPGQPILKSFSPGKTLFSARRALEILIQGIDSNSYSNFVIHRKILIDEQHGDKYTLHLHPGSFKSLPLHIDSAAELEQYVS